MKYFYLGAPFNTSIAKTNAVADLLDATGSNSGNLLIGDALRRHLNVGPPVRGFSSIDVKSVEEEYDAIIIGAANFLHEKFDFGYHADFIEKIKLPTIIIGVGAQAPNYGTKINIPEGTKRFMKIISERSHSMGVRGYYTAYVLNEIGIKNVRAIGCPSLYWSRKPEIKILQKDFKDCKRIVVNGSSNVVEHSVDKKAAQKVESYLANLSYKYGYPYVLQNELDEMKIIFNEKPVSGENSLVQRLKERYALRSRYGLLGVSDKDFTAFIQNNMKVFFDVEDWMNFIHNYDLVIGTRFHGTLIGLLTGVPSILLFHDSRTREMAELLNIPRVDIRSSRDLSLRKIYEDADFSALEVVYQYMYRNYKKFLNDNELEHTLS